MSNSALVNYTKISPNSSNPRKDTIKKITIHHMAGNLTVETCGNVFAPTSRQASSNYGIGTDGRVGMYVEEKNRAWTSSSASNDNQAVTIEVANDQIGGDWHVSDKALTKLIDLCVDICQRNGIEKLNYTGDANGNLTRHNMFASTSCPGPYLQGKFPYIAEEVNKRLNAGKAPAPARPGGTLYYVQTGAYSNKSNADTQMAKVKAAGFEAIMKQSGNLYRVQVGAYSQKANADAMAAKLKAAGFDTFVTTTGGTTVTAGSTPAAPAPVNTIKVGSKVKVRNGATTYSGGTVASFVYKNVYDVQQINGDRVVIGLNGKVTAAIKLADLILQ
jgi:hypothetical protein